LETLLSVDFGSLAIPILHPSQEQCKQKKVLVTERGSVYDLGMATKYLVIPATDLSQLEVYCPHCKSGFLLNAGPDGERLHDDCPFCPNDLPTNLVKGIKAYRTFFNETSGLDVKFRVKIHSQESKAEDIWINPPSS